MAAAPSRSASVRDTFKIRWQARGDSAWWSLAAGVVETAVPAQAVEVELRVDGAATPKLDGARRDDALAHPRAALGRRALALGQKLLRPHDLDLQVDAVQQRAGDARAVAADLFCGAVAQAAGVAGVAAGAGLRCSFAVCPHSA
jgi:hypothetical protein